MSNGSWPASKGSCAKIVLAVFGGLLLIALLSVPVTTTESSFRQDKGSLLIFRSTYPKNSTMFLPSYLAAKANAKEGTLRLRSAQWLGTMAIILGSGPLRSSRPLPDLAAVPPQPDPARRRGRRRSVDGLAPVWHFPLSLI